MSAVILHDDRVAVPQPLDPLRFPLTGRSLIEASAGTGKTFTIAMLYVRLVLGHDGDSIDADTVTDTVRIPLTPPEILVVTFTDAATKELRDRIRARLTEAAACFLVPFEDVEPRPRGEDLLHDLRDDYPPERWTACARKLERAAESMDEAAVSTIHGWCNRMLREHAFDSDSLFTQSLETDQTELLADVVRDYWRCFMSSLDAHDAATVGAWCADPDALRAKVRVLLEHAEGLADGLPPRDAVSRAKRDAAHALAQIKASWRGWIDDMERDIDAARDAGQFAPRKLAKAHCTKWFNALRSWVDDEAQIVPALTPTAWSQLSASGLRSVCVRGEPPSHEGFAALEMLEQTLAALPDAREAMLCHAVKWIARRFADEQGRRSQMGFNELLTTLDAALRGPNGARLASVIRTQFPVALIDEFQDTDPVQYRIFDTVYGDLTHDGMALIMIGDPKQAIYAFRGADIYTYLAARRACGDRLYTLTRNFRSTRAMVEAVNACFALAEQRADGAGAFLFRTRAGNPVPFVEVDAQGRGEALVVDRAPAAALTAWWLPAERENGKITKGAFLERMALACASEMVRLLNEAQEGRTGFASGAGFRPLRPADLAVLVNNRGEADAIRTALARRGVRSVYLSDKDSVMATASAAEIQHWLAACADPDDGRLVRTALATRTLGLAWADIEALRRDELAWEACVMRFRAYRECWRRQGVLPMLRRMLHDYRVPARWLALPGGERALTDLLHVSELLQQAATLIEGEHGLIRWLAEERQAALGEGASAGDARQMRLESDDDLVKVVTVHKSKGLEYPLVFLPFACTFREVGAGDVPLKWHDDGGGLHVELSPSPESVLLADHERLAEDLRKLYVALTRARYATWVGLAGLDGVGNSAFGYLLGSAELTEPSAIGAVLEARLGTHTDIAVGEAPAASDARYVARVAPTPTGHARTSVEVVRERWWISSYSSLKTASDGHAIAADTPDEDVMIELLDTEPLLDDASRNASSRDVPVVSAAVADVPPNTPALPPIHDFPRGSDPGTFLHDLLEWAAAEGFKQIASDPEALRDAVARRCNLRGWERWIDTLTHWVRRLVEAPLAVPGTRGGDQAEIAPAVLRLADLDLGTYLAEMEFWVAAHAVETERIDALVCRHTLDGAPRPALEPSRLNGMLKGFMDLVVEHEGRYYVVDYKSNWLGPDDAAYSVDRMRAEILHARYELQYVLYLFALHRLLKLRVPDYDYDRHIGAAVYLFIRGVDAPTRGVHVERPPRALIEALDAMFAHRQESSTDAGVFA
ncbi:exodeoxyribonuclease V subunit beta [Pararobbsia silviterrae]|uniref:RecBCD enzyme subunit RecB n=1 Tax=Pararobbsia silviterrae TaxID=1792498 RepID=A0A494XPT7_9BURK|nr:exodeoxyribonuclease V subunit beta [Pararobbsia silviterrae]RKP51822.1 exodeoxyribonuclease V subunit beta [Pararobbsia silviterrae]